VSGRIKKSVFLLRNLSFLYGEEVGMEVYVLKKINPWIIGLYIDNNK
jgi:hypothetical protein